MKGLANRVLFDAFSEMTEDGGEEKMREACAAFNDSLMFFLPKKAPCRTANAETYYEPGGVRHLNVKNTDNRKLASAVWFVVKAAFAGRVTKIQRGFRTGRSTVPAPPQPDASPSLFSPAKGKASVKPKGFNI